MRRSLILVILVALGIFFISRSIQFHLGSQTVTAMAPSVPTMHRGSMPVARRDRLLKRDGLPPEPHPNYELDHIVPICLGDLMMIPILKFNPGDLLNRSGTQSGKIYSKTFFVRWFATLLLVNWRRNMRLLLIGVLHI
jgi:hypothetical protein